MKILFCFDNSAKSIYFESITEGFLKRNIEVKALFFCKKGILQERLEKQGIECFNYECQRQNILSKTFYNTRFLVSLVKKLKSDSVFSHLVYANFYAALASKFLSKTKVVVCRHHSDQFYRDCNNKAIRFDKIINFLSPHILVVSQNAYNHLTQVEKVPSSKVTFLPLVYDFKKYVEYEKPYVAPKNADITLRVLIISRFVAIKRIDSFFPVIKHFKEKNIKIELQIIGNGPLENTLKQQVQLLGIAALVHFLGHQENVIPFIEKADLVANLSISESSNQVVKEAGYCSKAVIACRGVGDFDEYLNEENAYLLEKNFSIQDLVRIVENTEGVIYRAINLRKTILYNFSINDIKISKYINLLH